MNHAQTTHRGPASGVPCRGHLAAHAMALLLLLISSTLAGCGGRGDPPLAEARLDTDSTVQGTPAIARTPSESAPQTASLPTHAAATAPRGRLLEGLPGTNAYASLSDVAAGDPAASETPSAARIRLIAVIDRSATVGQVNAVLNEVGARIVSMQPGNDTLSLEVKSADGPPSIQDTAARLLATRAFQSVQGPGLAPVTRADARAPIGPDADAAVAEPIDDHAPPP